MLRFTFFLGIILAAESRAKLYSFSFVYFYGDLVFGIPPGRPYTSLQKLVFPFGIKVWYCLGLVFVVATILIVSLKLGAEKRRAFVVGKAKNPFLNMINISFGGALCSNKVPVRNFARTMLIMWLLSSLVLRNAYQGLKF